MYLLFSLLTLLVYHQCPLWSHTVMGVAAATNTPVTINLLGMTGALDFKTLTAELANFTKEFPSYSVAVTQAPKSSTDLLNLILNTYLKVQRTGMDVFPSDVIWPGDLAPYLEDLKGSVEESDFDANMIENTMVHGELVTVPWFTDYPLLYYRKDLLEKYFNDSTPPETWDDLEEMSMVIQAGERSEGNINFWGYVWQGKSYEGLMCNVMEWVNSHGGGTILDSSRKVTVNNPMAKKALSRALGWMGSITPYTVLDAEETASEAVWLAGNAAFMRNWPYALFDSNESTLRGKFGIALLPKDNSTVGKHAGTLGGWNLAVSKYSLHQQAAKDLLVFLTSAEQQKYRFQSQISIPTRDAVRNDPHLCDSAASGEVTLCDLILPHDYIVPRPSTPSAPYYADVSRIVYTTTNKLLLSNSLTLGKLDSILLQLECDIANLLFSPLDMPPNCITDLTTSSWVIILTMFIAVIGLLISLATIVFVFVAWNSAIIRASSQVFMLVLSIGLFFSFLYQLLLIGIAASGQLFGWGCYVSPFLAGLVFSMVIGSLSLKTFRIYVLLRAAEIKLEARVIPITQLLQTLLAIFIIDCLISATWMGLSPPTYTRIQSSTPGTFVYKCTSPLTDIFSGIHIGWRALVLLITTILAFQSRNIPTVFNESRSLGFVIYNAAFLGLLYSAMSPVISKTANYDLLLQILCISVPMFVAIALCFGVKFHSWRTKTDNAITDEVNRTVRDRVNSRNNSSHLSTSSQVPTSQNVVTD